MTKKGFTLLELVIAMALASIVMLFASVFLVQSLKNTVALFNGSKRTYAELRVLRRFSSDFRSSNKFDISGERVTMSFASAESVSYDLANKKVRRKEGKHSAYLTDDNEIYVFYFKQYGPRSVFIYINSGEALATSRNI